MKDFSQHIKRLCQTLLGDIASLNPVSSDLQQADLTPQKAWPGNSQAGIREGKGVWAYFAQNQGTNKLPTGIMQIHLLHINNQFEELWVGEYGGKAGVGAQVPSVAKDVTEGFERETLIAQPLSQVAGPAWGLCGLV